MLKQIFVNAGHSLFELGKVTQYGAEAEINRLIRDELLFELVGQGFEVYAVPDALDLKKSIIWVNDRVKNLNDGLAIDIHCNCCGETGAEAYYYATSVSSRDLARKLIDAYSKEMDMINRGARPDNMSQYDKLAWIRDTNCWGLLLECGFLDRKEDADKIKDYKKTAKAIAVGICAVYGIDYKTPLKERSKEEIKKEIIKLLEKL